jgi:AraC-like DNA-binding protein/two-component sensor histidine kinase
LSLEKAEADKLRELDRLKSNFFANISHEFRTPLTLIQTPLQQALSENGKEEYIKLPARFARSMHRNAQRLLHLVNQLLDLAKLEGGRMQLKVQQRDIAHIIRTIDYGFESMAQRMQINYQVNVKDQVVDAWFGQDKLEHILTNLLSNAFKFTSPEGWIILEAQFNKPEEVTITVRDNGIGIAEDQLPHIFERFYTINDKASDFTGSGIGMALTRELVELHHGKTEVESKVDQGTVFTITLPIAVTAFSEKEISKDKKAVPVEKLSSSPSPEYNRSILIDDNSTPVVALIQDQRPIVQIVEDNQDLRTYIRDVLHQNFLNQVLTAIESNMEEEIFSVVERSELVAMSRSQLHRKLKSLVNKSPNQIIREMRLQRTKELLEKKAGNASEIAFMVGFNSLAYFSKCFKDQFGLAPSEVAGGSG